MNKILILLFFIISYSVINAANRFSVVTGNWNSNSTWSATSGGTGGASYPVAGDVVTIEGGHNVTLTTNAACASITFTTVTATSLTLGVYQLDVSGAITIPRSAAGFNQVIVGAGILNAGSVAFTSGGGPNHHQITISTGTVTVSGDITTDNTGLSATIAFSGAGLLNVGVGLLTTTTVGGTLTIASGCTVNYNASGAQTVHGFTYQNLTLSGSGAKTTTGVTVNGILSIEDVATASAAPTYGTTATLQYNTSTARTAGVEWITPFAATGGVIIANTGAITLNAAKVLNASVPLNINNGATLNTSAANNYQMTFGGDFINNNGTFAANASPVVITNNASVQSIDGFTTTGLVSMTKTAGTATFQDNVNGGGLTINGTGGTLNLGTGLTHSFSGIVTLSAGTLNGGSSTLNENMVSTTAWNGTGTVFTAGTGTVNFGGAGTQTLSATTTTFNNLTFSNSGAKTLANANTVNGIFSIEGTATATLTGALTYGATATLQYKTTDTHTAGTEWPATFAATGGVIIANTAGSVTLNGAKVFNASVPLAINSGATINTSSANNYQVSFGGDFHNYGGTFTANASQIVIAGTAGTQSIDGFTTTGTISMTKTAGIATFQGNVNGGGLTINGTGGTLNLGTGLTHTFTGVVTLTAGSLNGGSSILNENMVSTTAWNGTGTVFTAGTGTVNFGAAGAQTLSATTTTFNNLTFSNSGAKILANANTVNGIFSIEGTATATLTGALTYGASATLQYKTTDTHTTGTEWPATFAGSGGVIIANTAGSVTLNGAKVFNASVPLTINNGATLNTSAASNYALTFGGNFDNNGTFTANGSTITITGTAAQSIDGITTTGTISMTKTSGTAALQAAISTGTLSLDGSGGLLGLGTYTSSATNLTLGGYGQPNGSWGGTGSGATYINSSYFAAATGILNVSTSSCNAGTWIGGTSTDWNTASNWCGSAVPTSATNVIIPSGGNQPVIGASAVCNNLTINTGASLSISGSNTLTISGNFSNSGNFTTNNSTVIYNNAGAQTCAVVTYNNLTLSNSGTKTFATTPTVNGILSMEETATITVTTGVVTYGANATLQYNTSTARTSTPEEWITPFIATGGIIIANTGAITMDAAKVFNASVPLTLNNGATLVISTFLLTLNGNFINNGGTTSGSGGVTITGTSTQSIGSFTNSGTVSMTKTGGIATLQGNVNRGGLTINGTGGTLNLGTGLTHSFGGIVTLSAGTLNGGSSTLNENMVSTTAWNGTGT
ncbi:MAG: hypothetical protein NTW49_00790, partial [Bacteroidia bacterium]|nr:hypothetical protein [Bacteroidia bacterium]